MRLLACVCGALPACVCGRRAQLGPHPVRRRGSWIVKVFTVDVAGNYDRRMDRYEPVMSFGEEVAEVYDDVQRGDESETVAFLEQLAGGGPALIAVLRRKDRSGGWDRDPLTWGSSRHVSVYGR